MTSRAQGSIRLALIGSLLFVVGACINILQIVQSRSMVTLQPMNLTAIAFVVGAVLFTVASVPYLWNFAAKSDRTTLYAFLAWQYLVGSVLFFLGVEWWLRRRRARALREAGAIIDRDVSQALMHSMLRHPLAALAVDFLAGGSRG